MHHRRRGGRHGLIALVMWIVDCADAVMDRSCRCDWIAGLRIDADCNCGAKCDHGSLSPMAFIHRRSGDQRSPAHDPRHKPSSWQRRSAIAFIHPSRRVRGVLRDRSEHRSFRRCNNRTSTSTRLIAIFHRGCVKVCPKPPSRSSAITNRGNELG